MQRSAAQLERKRLEQPPPSGFRAGGGWVIALVMPLAVGCSSSPTLLLGETPSSSQSAAITSAAIPAAAAPGRNVPAIHVNTVGYPNGWRRLAMFTVNPAEARLWHITSAWTAAGQDERPITVSATRWRPQWQNITAKGTDSASGDTIWVVDFDDYRPPRGAAEHYYVLAVGLTQQEVQAALGGSDRRFETSAPFRLGSFFYQQAARRLLTSLYQQRCHTSLGPTPTPCSGATSVAPEVVQQPVYASFVRESACHCQALKPLCAAPEAADEGWAADCDNAELTTTIAGGWHHGAGHGIYLATLAPTVQALATVALRAPELFGVGADSQLLAEIGYGLQWVERMQLRSEPAAADQRGAPAAALAGGFYAFEIPWSSLTPQGSAAGDQRERYRGPIATSASAKATAALAVVSRLYRELARGCNGAHCADWEALAERTASAAASGFSFLIRHPRKLAVPVAGHGHPLWDDAASHGHDDGVRLNAAVQVWALTGDEEVLEWVKRYAAAAQASGEHLLDGSWANPARTGLATLAACRAHLGGCSDGFVRSTRGTQRPSAPSAPPYPDLAAEAQRRLFVAASELHDNIEDDDGYRVASRPDDYVWGHNARLMEKAALLTHAAQHYRRLAAYRARIERSAAAPDLAQLEVRLKAMADVTRLPGEPAPKALDLGWALEAGRDQWHWVMGRNPNGYAMITGVGRAPTAMVHHEWQAKDAVLPGYLLGGPNAQQLGFLAPGTPAKALLLEHQGRMWHTDRALLGDYANGADVGWWAAAEGSVYYTGVALVALAELYRGR